MRFTRFPRTTKPSEYVVTPRKVAAHHNGRRRERESLPLFAAEIAAEQSLEPPVNEVMAHRAIALAQGWDQLRSANCRWWLQVRAVLRCLPEADQREILASWNRGWLPGSSNYLAGLVRERCHLLGLSYDSLVPARLRA